MSETNEKVDYKDTLNLPQTDFPMKGKLPEREPKFIKNWEDNSLYEKILERNANKPVFSMPDGPPYANGNIHIGHVLNKVLKDILVKYKNLKGYQTVFIPGWDGHGLPIEHKVTKELGSKRKDMNEKDIRSLCRKEARKWVKTQGDQFRRLGILADWENPYVTVDADYEAEEVRELARIFERGIIYRGEKPVYWCWALQTALAEAEVEYADHKSPSVYVKFDINGDEQKGKLGLKSDDNVSCVIWTTTPWTLPANLAIAVNEDLEYSTFSLEFNNKKQYIVIATELQESFEKATELSLTKIKTFSGNDLVGIKTTHPFIDRESPIVLGHHVSLEAGTGCVHTAPGHGQDDYIVGLKYDLPPYSPVDAKGRYTSDVPEYEGEMIFDCNPKIVERLTKSRHLLAHKEIKHSYPHCWRSKTPLIFRATPQWFLNVDHESFNVRKKALTALNDIEFIPKWGESRIRSMIENRPDWCLSRQRMWGVPIPVFYCKECDEAIINSKIMMAVADDMEENNGIEAYFDADPKKYIGDDAKCAACGHDQFNKGKDILDVWFDSGVCHAAVQKNRDGLTVPADIYLEGSDQHRGWFQTSLLASIASNNKAPFKALITHGFVNDMKGRKMSKSLGNVVDPADWIKTSGAEILRLYSAYEDYGQDLTCGPEHFKRVTDSYRKFRNTMRFLLGNLSGFDPETQNVQTDQMLALDRWMLHRLNLLIEKTTEAYDCHTFYKVYHALNHFMTVELSATYLDILKDRLYTAKTNGLERKSAQTVLYTLTTTLSSVMAPILSFLAEETYSFTPSTKKTSIFLEDFPLVNENWWNTELDEDFQKITAVRSKVLKEIEILRAEKTIRSSLEAKVNLTVSSDSLLQTLQKYDLHLAEYFIVSQVNLTKGDNLGDEATKVKVEIEKALGKKCDRCWNYSEQTGENEKFVNTCPKCVTALG